MTSEEKKISPIDEAKLAEGLCQLVELMLERKESKEGTVQD